MNKLLIMLWLLSGSGSVAFAQIRVGAGESWSYEFTSNSLPLLEIQNMAPLIGANTCGGANLTLSSTAPGTLYTVSLYQDTLSQAPWAVSTNSPGNGGCVLWQDLQGWAQVHVISGALTIDEIQFDVRIPINATNDTFAYHYESIIPVVAPPQLGLTQLAGKVVLNWPTNYLGYRLQFTTNLASSVWITNSAAPVIVNGLNMLTNDARGNRMFFRLSK